MLKRIDKQTRRPGQAFLEALATVPLQAMDAKRDRTLPKGPGEKQLKSEETCEEAERLKGYLSEQMLAQSTQRITSRKLISTATWNTATQLATITTQKGSHWSTHGHTHSGQLMLVPHEALFLLEMGCLELKVDGLSMTLQQAYHTLLGSNLPLREYTVIGSLKRCGYVVRRCYISNGSTSTDTPTNSTGGDALQLLSLCPLCNPLPWPLEYISLLEVYHPRGSSFKKSNPGPPQFRVCVVSPHDPFPSPSLLNQLTSLTPPAALRCCVVDGSSLTYYTITQGIVPSSSSPPPTT